MNKYIVTDYNKNAYSVLSKNELIKRFGSLKFHRLKDIVHGENVLCYIGGFIAVYDMITNCFF